MKPFLWFLIIVGALVVLTPLLIGIGGIGLMAVMIEVFHL